MTISMPNEMQNLSAISSSEKYIFVGYLPVIFLRVYWYMYICKKRVNLVCKYTYMRLDSNLKDVKSLSSLFWPQRIELWNELVMSLEDHLGVPYCEIGAPIRWKLKMKKLCSQTNDFLCYSVTAGNPLKAHLWLKQEATWLMAKLKEYISAILWRYDNLILLGWKVCTWNSVTLCKLYRQVE